MCGGLIDVQGYNFFLLMTGVGLLSSCQWISRLYCLRVLFFFEASSCSGSSLCLLYLPKVCCVPSNSLNTTSSRWRSCSNHQSMLGPWRSHWLSNKAGASGSGVGMLLFGSLSSGRAETWVIGANEGCGSPNLRAWVMFWEGLWGWR